MKKIITALTLALLLVFSMAGGAFADITYTSPGDVEVGVYFKHLLATVSIGSPVSSTEGTLPPGCQVSVEEASGGVNVYLTGTPTTVGSYNCVVDLGNNNSLICPVNVIAARPTVTVSEPVTCYINAHAQVSVTASIAGNGSLSYQWYVSSVNSTANGQLISGAVNPTYVPNTAYVGSSFYYCIVTNTAGTQARSTVSDTIEVKVTELQVNSVTINTMPEIMDYMEGDTINTQGLSIRVEYADGSNAVLSSGFGVYPTTLDSFGQQEIQISYMGKTCTFNVNVDTDEEILEGIGVLTLPHKTRYEVGENLDSTGLTVKAYTNKGEKTVSDGLSCVPTVLNIVGEQTVTVRYMDKSCTFTVTVEEEEVPIRIDVASRAQKLDYNVGDSLDTTGLIIRLTGSNGGSEEIKSGFTCEPAVLSTAGRQKITVSYEGFQCTYYVTVTDKNPAATTTPAPSSTIRPSQTPAPTTAPSVNNNNNDYEADTGISNSVLVVIMVIALVIMFGLGIFVFVMQHGGIKNMLRRFTRK